ncbi:MAG: bifunctional riboflavin kinase/FAD synthetase [Armatimonadota bacterium]
MRRVLGLEQLGEPLARSVVTIGKFFAIHRGHQELLRRTAETARRQRASSVVLTFDRHPIELLRPGTQVPVLAGLEERLELIERFGIEIALVIPLTPEFLSQEPEAFVREILVRQLGAVEVLAGANFRFGRGARGDLDLLRGIGSELGFTVTAVEPVLEGGHPISSSRVAACLEEGCVASAERLLGRPYSVPGEVVAGEQVGRRLGFPTANIRVPTERMLPADGVYVAQVRLPGHPAPVPAAVNLGVRPTRDGTRRVLEAHLLDWSGDLYGQRVQVEFLQRLRGEQRFADLDSLRAQIARDVQAAREHFER